MIQMIQQEDVLLATRLVSGETPNASGNQRILYSRLNDDSESTDDAECLPK